MLNASINHIFSFLKFHSVLMIILYQLTDHKILGQVSERTPEIGAFSLRFAFYMESFLACHKSMRGKRNMTVRIFLSVVK